MYDLEYDIFTEVATGLTITPVGPHYQKGDGYLSIRYKRGEDILICSEAEFTNRIKSGEYILQIS